MSRFLLAALPLLAAGCATSSTPYAPVSDVAYQAMGVGGSSWIVVIGDDRILFRVVGHGPERSWPRVLPRTVDGVRIWQSGTAEDGITITARPGPCASADRQQRELSFEHNVTVRLGEGEYRGCGGRLLEREGR
jgi:uncharacterized membrane protein